mmetsp:Transcript_11451/g.23980  ORF Transcript_11451/g.23980 Transcript_11451/m.23980 type:complete len:761 (-) Transcript_11451:168-2450(-)
MRSLQVGVGEKSVHQQLEDSALDYSKHEVESTAHGMHTVVVPGRKVKITCPVARDYDDGRPWFPHSKVALSEFYCKKVFAKFDRRETGSFQKADVKSFFRSDASSELFLKRFDVNGDGDITFDEFFATMQNFVDEHGHLSFTERIYITFSEPGSSTIGFILSLYIMGLILVSTACFVLETQKNYWSDSTVDPECCWRTNSNGDIKFMLPDIDVFGVDGRQLYEESEETRYVTPECSCTTEGLGKVISMLGVRTCVEAMCKFYEATSTNTSRYKWNEPACICEPQPQPFFATIEVFCIAMFTIEYVARLLTVVTVRFSFDKGEIDLNVAEEVVINDKEYSSSHNFFGFVFNVMNGIDLAAILPFYIDLMVDGGGGGLGFLRVLRLARVFRVFKMGKYNKGMQLVSRVMAQSSAALQLMLFFTFLGMILFGSMLYFCELGEWKLTDEYPDGVYMRVDATGLDVEPSPFTSIPTCFWWVIVTQTTVGYGDTYPTTMWGKAVGCVTMLSGVLVLALPITIIGANFANEYSKSQEQEACDKADEEAKLIEQQRKIYKLEEAAKQGGAEGQKASSRLSQMGKRSKSVRENRTIFGGFGGGKKVEPGKKEQGARESGVESKGMMQSLGLAAKTPVVAQYQIGTDEEDLREKEAIEAYEVSKAAALKLTTIVMLMVRDLIDASKMPRVPGTEIIRELEEGQAQISAGLPIVTDFVTRQISIVLLWIERAETESSLHITQRDANKIRKHYLELAGAFCGAVANGDPRLA